MITWNRLQGFVQVNAPAVANSSGVVSTENYYVAPLCVPNKKLYLVASEARSRAIQFLYSLYYKAQDSADCLQMRLAGKTRLPGSSRRLSLRTKRILGNLAGSDFIDPDSLNSHDLKEYFGDLSRLVLALDMFSSAEMNDRTGRKIDEATLDAILMARDAEEARVQVQTMIENAESHRKGIRNTKTIGPGHEWMVLINPTPHQMSPVLKEIGSMLKYLMLAASSRDGDRAGQVPKQYNKSK